MTVRKLLVGAGVLSVAAVLAPAVSATERPDDRADRTGVGGVSQTESIAFDAVGTADTVEARIRAGLDGRGALIAPTRPDDRAERVTPVQSQPVTPEPTATTGIEWSDPLVVVALVALAGLGLAAGAFGVIHYRGGGTGRTGKPGKPAPTH